LALFVSLASVSRKPCDPPFDDPEPRRINPGPLFHGEHSFPPSGHDVCWYPARAVSRPSRFRHRCSPCSPPRDARGRTAGNRSRACAGECTRSDSVPRRPACRTTTRRRAAQELGRDQVRSVGRPGQGGAGPTSKKRQASPATPAISSTRPAPQGNNTATAVRSPVSLDASDQITRAKTAARECPPGAQGRGGPVRWMMPTSVAAPGGGREQPHGSISVREMHPRHHEVAARRGRPWRSSTSFSSCRMRSTGVWMISIAYCGPMWMRPEPHFDSFGVRGASTDPSRVGRRITGKNRRPARPDRGAGPRCRYHW